MNKMRKPLLTAIIPIYNGEKNLRETLNNILQIKYQALELLLINDGSSDSSDMICREYEALDERIHYIRQENRGIAASRNRGLDLARGEYICFWDQDDIVLEEGYFELLDKIQNESAQMGMCSTSRLIQGKASNYESLQDRIYSGEGIQKGLLYPLLFRGYQYDFVDVGNYLYGSVWKCIFRTDFIRYNYIQFQKFVNYEDDWIFVTHALSCAQKVVTISQAGYCWRINENSESHKGIYVSDLQKRFKALDEYVFKYLKNSIKDETILDEYKKVNLCEHYVELYRNTANVRLTYIRECHKNVKEYLYDTSYKSQLLCRKKLRKSAYRRRIVLNSLQYGGIAITYLVSRVYDRLEHWMERIQWIVDIERRHKMK